MGSQPRGTSPDAAAFAGIRTILVPPDIVAVQRQSPLPVRKRTPWHPQPDGQAITERAGAREWFSDRLFVEAQDGHARSAFSTSVAAHLGCAAVLIALVLTGAAHAPLVRVGSIMMPVMNFVLPIADASSPAPRLTKQPAPKAEQQSSAEPPAPPAGVSAPAPIDAPSSITPETGAESGGDGVEGGVAGGVPGGRLGGGPSSGSGSLGPMRVGGGIKPPRKIKDVRPVYPPGALLDQSRGIVIVEATIGIDGKVQEAAIVQSIPALDRAALDAVRQWEYAPSLLNGVRVAVIITVIVNFAIQ